MSLSEASIKSLGLKYKNLFKSKEDFNIIFINNHNLKIIISSNSLEKILNLSSITLENLISLINLSIYHQSEVKAFDEGNTKNFSDYIQTKPLFGININDRLRIMINKFSLEYILQLQNLDFEDLLSYISLDVVEEIENEYKEIINKSRTITEFNHKSLKNQTLENNNEVNNKNMNNTITNNENDNNEKIINYNKDAKSKKFIKSKVFFKDFNPCLKNIGKILENIVKEKDKIREKAHNYLNDKNNEISKVEPNFIRKVYLKKIINVIKKKNRIKVFDIHGNQVIINKRDIENYDENKIYILIKDMNNNNIVVSLEDLKNKINDWGLLEKKINLKNEENNNDIEIQIKDLDFPKIFMENMEKHYQMNEEFELEKNKEKDNEIKEDNKEINEDNNEIKEDKEDNNEIKEDNKENNNEIKEENKEDNNEIKEDKEDSIEIKEDKENNIEIKEDNNEIKEDNKEDNNEIKEDKEDNSEIKENNKEDNNEKEEDNIEIKEDNKENKILLDKNTENNEEEEKEIILNENDNNQEENFEINTKNEKENINNNITNSHLYKLNSIQENENEDEDNENNNNLFDTPIDYGNEDKNKNIIIDEIPIEDHNIIDDGKYNEEPKSSNDYVTLTSLIKNNDKNNKLKHHHPNNLSFDQSSNIKSENIAKKNSYHRRLVSTPNPLFKMNLNFETSLKMKSGQIGRPLKIRREIYRSFS